MSAKNIKARYVIGALVVFPLLFWYMATPVVRVHYSKEGTDELRLIWNTQHSIHKEGMLPGQATYDTGHIFPNEKFFMNFDWWNKKTLRRCINITPKWGSAIDIYLDGAGRIDTVKTAPDVIARLKRCEGDSDPFRS
ncbi:MULTISPECIES: hypothetical protein [Pseudomonas]|uniref:hypothetical protein n=1 Tax=Pseudomonas TaxID=286 RepID=UPI0009B89FBD|nr:MULTISPECIES: hypothetical protein [Pseudomonas]KAA5847321.1 hypothetical protein F2A37_03365 [Pseudomonas chlororaphis]KAB0527799.1 hypothetical protein F7R16_25330 [Pseudomonas chlororaphis subsp. aureofaciens]MBP5061332.1 hypothetical protein [Pseudomonas chlororaphis]PWY36729.1 hypothetical protein DK261_30110 [Pseudomonas sp. RW409]QHC87471.1 hypothetical protein PchlR47_03745 [Pseudomonas chlororaphis]